LWFVCVLVYVGGSQDAVALPILHAARHLPIESLDTGGLFIGQLPEIISYLPHLLHVRTGELTCRDIPASSRAAITAILIGRPHATLNGNMFGICLGCSGPRLLPRCSGGMEHCRINSIRLCFDCRVLKPCGTGCDAAFHWSIDPTKRCAPVFSCAACEAEPEHISSTKRVTTIATQKGKCYSADVPTFPTFAELVPAAASVTAPPLSPMPTTTIADGGSNGSSDIPFNGDDDGVGSSDIIPHCWFATCGDCHTQGMSLNSSGCNVALI
jgi:hypothetical protein